MTDRQASSLCRATSVVPSKVNVASGQLQSLQQKVSTLIADDLHALLTLRRLYSRRSAVHRRNVGFFSWAAVVSAGDLYRTPISSVRNPSFRACT
jgi:hypothetical protein